MVGSQVKAKGGLHRQKVNGGPVCAPLNSCMYMYSTKSSLNMSDTVPSRSTLLDESGELHSTKVELRREANGINESFSRSQLVGTQIQR